MEIKLTKKELFEIVSERLDYDKSKINTISIEVELQSGFKDIVVFRKNDWFLGSFAEDEIVKSKQKGE